MKKSDITKKYKFKKDYRDKLWAELEQDIQKVATKKDKKFSLSGKWKKFLRRQDGFNIFAVDWEWVNSNLSVIFGHGGHGYVHEFIPLDEIWVSTHHYYDCECVNAHEGMKLSKAYFDSTVIHEIAEFKAMKKGIKFWPAHHIALQKEIEAGLLQDPYTEVV